MDEIKIPYKCDFNKSKFTLLKSAIFILIFAYLALTSKDNTDVFGLINLSASSISIIFGSLALIYSISFFQLIWLFYKSSKLERNVILSEDKISAPLSQTSETILAIPYTKIKALKTNSFLNHYFLDIIHNDGKLSITSSMLPSKTDFDTIVDILKERTDKSNNN